MKIVTIFDTKITLSIFIANSRLIEDTEAVGGHTTLGIEMLKERQHWMRLRQVFTT